jgi:hypothetical protein
MASFKKEPTNFMTDEINDVLLEKRARTTAAQRATTDEEIYELAAEDEISDATHPHSGDSLSEQVDQLCREYAAINLQLQNSLAASTKLNTQLENAQQGKASSHLALFVAALALVGVAAIAAIGWEVYDKLTQVDTLLATLQKQSADASQVTARLDAVDEKVSRIFAAENVDGVLQVTRALKAQVDKLADASANSSVNPLDESASANHSKPSSAKFAADEHNTVAKHTEKPKVSTTAQNHLQTESAKKSSPDKKTPKAEPAKVAALDKAQNKEPAVKIPSLDSSDDKEQPVKVATLDNAKDQDHPLVFPSLAKTDDKEPPAKVTELDKAQEQTESAKKAPPAKTADSSEKSATIKSNWLISLGSFKNKSIAKQRADGFKKAGVSVQLIEVQAKNQTWYRVVTKTTKTKQEAENYAERVKRTLKLGSVSMTKN